MGRPITHWIIEANAAQKFILQYDHFKRWAAMRGVELVRITRIPATKATPSTECKCLLRYGVGRVRLPGKQRTEARPAFPFSKRVTRWNPEGTGARTDDCVMAQWFMEHNF